MIDPYNTVPPRPLRHGPRFIQCIYRYSHASKRLVEVYVDLSRYLELVQVRVFEVNIFVLNVYAQLSTVKIIIF